MKQTWQIGLQIVRFVILISLIILIAYPSFQVQALATVFISPTGSGVADCSQEAPCTLSTGLATVDTAGMLYAAAGVYTAVTGDQVVLLDKTIQFLGGWDGAPSGPIIRNTALYESVLDGENERRVLTISLDTPGSMTVDGWTIRNGNATGLVDGCSAENAAGCGGGLQVITGLVTIEHCIIEENIAATTSVTGAITGYGGGIYLQNPSNMTIRYNLIRNNSASVAASGPTGSRGVGGGIYASGAYSEANLTISDNEFYGNETAPAGQTGYGAGMAFYNSHGLVTRNYVHNNDPSSSARGSGLALEQSDLTITRNYFMNNQGMDALFLNDF